MCLSTYVLSSFFEELPPEDVKCSTGGSFSFVVEACSQCVSSASAGYFVLVGILASGR